MVLYSLIINIITPSDKILTNEKKRKFGEVDKKFQKYAQKAVDLHKNRYNFRKFSVKRLRAGKMWKYVFGQKLVEYIPNLVFIVLSED